MFQERGSLSTNTGVAADLLLEGLEVGAGGGDPRIAGRGYQARGIGAHARGAELDAAEGAAVAAHAHLDEEDGAGRGEPDDQGDQDAGDQEDEQPGQRGGHVEGALERALAGGHEARTWRADCTASLSGRKR